MLRKGLASAVLLAACFSSPPILAQPVDDATRGAGRDLGYAGVDAYQAGNYALAAEKFEKAYHLLHAPSLGLWWARALVKLGRWVEASERYLEVTRLEPVGGKPAVQKQAILDAAAELAALKPKIPSVTITLEGAEPADVTITIDGTPISSALTGESRPINPGRHPIVAARGAERAEVEIEVAEGEKKTAVLRLSARAETTTGVGSEQPSGSAPSSTNVADEPRSSFPWRTVGWATLGVGVAGIAVGGVFGVHALNKQTELRDKGCGVDSCRPEIVGAKELVDEYNSARTVSTVGLWAGGALAAAGLTLVLVAPKSKRPVAFFISPTRALGLTGSF
jgi:hypothetical protein